LLDPVLNQSQFREEFPSAVLDTWLNPIKDEVISDSPDRPTHYYYSHHEEFGLQFDFEA